MTPVLERVRKLIALASSPYEEEARTAAYQAAKLIREHGLTVVAQASAQSQPATAIPDGYIVIRSKYAGRCRHCGDMYDEGDKIAWKRGSPTMHIECAKESSGG